MGDMELLLLAAKASGVSHIEYTNGYDGSDGLQCCDAIGRHAGVWSPLKNDGDALRLAVKLGLDVELHGCTRPLPYVAAVYDCDKGLAIEQEADDGDEYRATRRAIVRAAAEIGKQMP